MPFFTHIARKFMQMLGISGAEDAVPEEADVTLTYIRRDDAEMAAAWRQARETVQQFLDQLADPELSHAEFYVKKRFDQDDQSEHIWLSDIRVEDHAFVGKVGNDPGVVTDVRFGDEARVAFGEISDWMVMREDDMLSGGFTVELLMRRQSQQL